MNSRASITASLLIFATAAAAEAAKDADWPSYLGDNERSHYSPLKQINARNVSKLQVAWTYQSGGARPDGRSQIQCNPLIVDGVLYGTSPQLVLFALNAATGKELWRFNPLAGGGDHQALGVNRGLVYWADGNDRRILYSAGATLFAVNAADGKIIPSFGDAGRVNLKAGLGRDTSQLYVIATTPGIVFRDLLIMGSRVAEGPGPSAPGHIRAYDIRTGKQAWMFRTIPQPGEFGHETWPADAWKYIGGANCWAGMALDEKRGIVFVPTGSARRSRSLFTNWWWPAPSRRRSSACRRRRPNWPPASWPKTTRARSSLAMTTCVPCSNPCPKRRVTPVPHPRSADGRCRPV